VTQVGMSPPAAGVSTGERHGGQLALAAARRHGVQMLWTLSGGHVFPLYDAAVTDDPPMRILDVRHEQSAVFAAEATAKLTRTPGLAVLTAGPGVTNGVSAVTTAHFNGSPLLVLGGRAANARWGTGSLQELDHPPILAPVTKYAGTAETTAAIPARIDMALTVATTPHRGPVFVDLPLDVVFGTAVPAGEEPAAVVRLSPDPDDVARVAGLLRAARAPVLVLGSDVWSDRAEAAARRFAETLRLPVVANGMGRGVVPGDSELAVSAVRGPAFAGADLVLVAGTPLDFRLGFGRFGGRAGAPPAAVVHLVDAPSSLAGHVELAGCAAGDLTEVFDGVLAAALAGGVPDTAGWRDQLRGLRAQAGSRLETEMATDTDPIHPARVYGELLRLLDPDAVVICDGGDFVSFAGRYVESSTPGCWLDPGPYGCLGTGLGYAAAARIARPDAQVVVLLGDGAAGFSLLDVDTLVRHRLPVVLVVGNNGIWGLEKHPMRALYGYDVAADLQPGCRYDRIVTALGGHGELVERTEELGPALRRAFTLSRDSSLPAMVNVVLDPAVAYPRSSTLA
jgi:acetolactate synthase-1/2/3 large subunit